MILKLANDVGFKIDKIFYVDSIGFRRGVRIFGWNEKNSLGSKTLLYFMIGMFSQLVDFLIL